MVLADKIKHVEEHHLLELIEDTRSSAVHVDSEQAVSSVIERKSHYRTQSPAQSSVLAGEECNLPLHSVVDHPLEQEDYLWGV